MKFGFQEKIIAAAALLIIITAGWYFMFYGPKSGEIERNNQEINNSRMQIQQAISDPELLESLKKNIEELELLKKQNESLILPVDSILFVTETIKAKCAECQLDIMQPLTPDKERLFGGDPMDSLQTGIRMVQIDLYVKGVFFNLGHFLESLPGFPFLIRAGEIEIETNNDIYPELEAALKVFVFFRESVF